MGPSTQNILHKPFPPFSVLHKPPYETPGPPPFLLPFPPIPTGVLIDNVSKVCSADPCIPIPIPIPLFTLFKFQLNFSPTVCFSCDCF